MIDPRLESVLAEAQRLGFVGPAPVSSQIEHSAQLVGLLGHIPGRVLDLGSGGGLPGLVLTMLHASARVVLLDSRHRRCEFLEHAIAELSASQRCAVACGRAEDCARDPAFRGKFDLVMARSFGGPAVTAECAAGFLASGGVLAVSEPPGHERSTMRWPATDLAVLGFSPPSWRDGADAHLVVMTMERSCDERWPRRPGLPEKRPLWK